MRRTLMIRALAVPATAVLALGLLTGCGSSGDETSQVASVGDGTSAAPGADRSDAEQSQEFVDCVREHGVAMEDPDPETGELNRGSVTGGGVDTEKLQEVMTACRDLMPQSLATERQFDQEEARKFAGCMREQGVDMEDPGPEGFDDSVREQRDDPGFQDAMEQCRDTMPAGSGSAGE